MKLQCYMPVYNELDVLPHVLAHLLGQGVTGIHLIDGWSDDGSYEYAVVTSRVNPAITVEHFPPEGRAPIQECSAILRRIEDLAACSDADWILYSDADEWRRSSVITETLAQGIARIEALGYNAIDFKVYAFFCTDAEWSGLTNPEMYFRSYNITDMICRIPNRKLWRNVGRVTLAGGGHEVRFEGMRVSPERFVMKHYPFRTPEQAQRKIRTRLARRCQAEHARGWGVHYDEPFPPGFVWDAEQLKRWKNTETPLP